MSWTSERDEAEPPRFGRGGRVWFYRRVRRWALDVLRQAGNPLDVLEARAESIAGWFVAGCATYVQWQDDEEYRGPGFAKGGWHILWKRVELDYPRAFRVACGLPDPALPPPPIPPGPIDVDAALAALAVPNLGPEEKGVWALFHEARSRGDISRDVCSARIEQFSRARNRIRRKTARRCHCCEAWFVGRALHAVTCAACKQAGRKRCLDCQQVFKVPSGKVRRCGPCLAKAEAEASQRPKRRRK